jgi:multidrug resistance efflux pump
MKVAKVVLGLLLFLSGLYILVGEHLSGTSSDATVNARLTVLRAPIQGELSLNVRNIGARVAERELLAEIIDSRFDMSGLLNLERMRGTLETDLKRHRAEIAASAEAKNKYREQMNGYTDGRVQQLEARLAEADASQAAAIARLNEAKSAFDRSSILSKRGVDSIANLDRTRSAFQVAQQEINGAQQRQTYLKVELEAARKGIFLGDSYNDAPFSQQRLRDLDLRLMTLAAEEEQTQTKLKQITEQIAAERVRVNLRTSATLTMPARAIIWDFLVDQGEFVREGQDLIRLVDCNSMVITASVTESLYNTLQVGAPAQFRLFGDSRVFDATIIRLAGSGVSGLYTNLAVGPSLEHIKRYDVTLSVPDLVAQVDLDCAIGRTGRVVFTAGPLSRLNRLLARFGI